MFGEDVYIHIYILYIHEEGTQPPTTLIMFDLSVQ